MRFKFTEGKLVEKSFQKIKEQLGEDTFSAIGAVLAFEDSYVYDRPSETISGVLVLTGPILEFHVFLDRGLTRKYYGKLVSAANSVYPPMISDRKLAKTITSEPFMELMLDINELYPQMIDFLKTQQPATTAE